jgi:hypothetical protein
MDSCFSEPVLARVPGKEGRSDLLEIRTAREGLSAMHRKGLGGYSMDTEEWQTAADRLVKATLHPSPESTEAARAALARLACRSDAPLDG